ncbi:hypothetical protein BJ508DRAFT_350642 [Ascobolus immersus RN42]|uniref:Uncharacterized protein n=1 Tax=Ascobolus immersus RN42 TaxID=1160509 RepID=A0A3N4HU22_ASCIM|nr:hypothetical protein BJ508DRAFT_350642 [Ascobolus immersus RN42]
MGTQESREVEDSSSNSSTLSALSPETITSTKQPPRKSRTTTNTTTLLTSHPDSHLLAKTMALMGQFSLCNMRDAIDNLSIPHLICDSEIWLVNGETLQIIVPDGTAEQSTGMIVKVVFKEGEGWVGHSARELGRQVFCALEMYHHGVLEKAHELCSFPQSKLRCLSKYRQMAADRTGCYSNACPLISHITILWRGEAPLMTALSKWTMMEKAPYTNVLFSSASEETQAVWEDLQVMYSEACAAAGGPWHDCYRLNGMAGLIGPRWDENLTDLLTDLKGSYDAQKGGTEVQALYRALAAACLTHRTHTMVILNNPALSSKVKKDGVSFEFDFNDPRIVTALPSNHERSSAQIIVPNMFQLAATVNLVLKTSGDILGKRGLLQGHTLKEIWTSRRGPAKKWNSQKDTSCACCIVKGTDGKVLGNTPSRLRNISLAFWARRAYNVQSVAGWTACLREKEHLDQVLGSNADYLALDSLDQGKMGFTIRELVSALINNYEKARQICTDFSQNISTDTTPSLKLCLKCQTTSDFFFREVKDLHVTLILETESLIHKLKRSCSRTIRLAQGTSAIRDPIDPRKVTTGEALSAHAMETSLSQTGGAFSLFAPSWKDNTAFWEVPQELVDKVASLRANPLAKKQHADGPCLNGKCLVCHLRACEKLLARYTKNTPEMNLQGLEVAAKLRLDVNSSRFGACEIHAARLIKILKGTNECVELSNEECCESCCSWAHRIGGGARLLGLERVLVPELFKSSRVGVFSPGWKDPPMEAKRTKEGHKCPRLLVPSVKSVLLPPPPPTTPSEIAAIHMVSGQTKHKLVRPVLPPLRETELDTDPKTASLMRDLRDFELALSRIPLILKESTLRRLFGTVSPSLAQMEGKSTIALVDALRESYFELSQPLPDWLTDEKLRFCNEIAGISDGFFIGLVYNLQAGLLVEAGFAKKKFHGEKGAMNDAEVWSTDMPWGDVLAAYNVTLAGTEQISHERPVAASTVSTTASETVELGKAPRKKKRAGGKKKRARREEKDQQALKQENEDGNQEATEDAVLNLVLDSKGYLVDSANGANYGGILEFARHCAIKGGGKLSASLEARLQSLQVKTESQAHHREK